jgi:putative ABC transport system permease protein
VLAGIGIAAGLIGARYAAHWASSLLFGLSPGDPWVFIGAGGTLILIAVAATVAPARRAASVAPTLALRQD